MEPLQPGDPATVGRYRLGGRLGQGGMGRVYWGRSPSGRPVAIKVVHPHLATQPDFRRRFAHEVDAARRVGGFHTAPVVDADPAGDPPWLVTAYVAGPSLSAAVQRTGPFDVPTLRVLGAGLAEALEAVHAAGLVHRDLKPANILLTEDGPRVIDFGIARALDTTDTQGLTATGAAIGTPRYMAPEQFGDDPITAAADVFAWGTVICHAAGASPFGDGAAATVVGAILSRAPRLEAVPKPLLAVVSAALEKDPARRPTPAQLLDALSDGSSSDGWLPPAVAAMLPEHVLPDATRAPERTEVVTTQVLDGGPTERVPPPPRTRQFSAPPGLAPAEQAPPARGRGSALVIGVAVSATLLIIVAIIVGISLSGQRRPSSSGAAPTSEAAASTAEATGSPTPTPDAAAAPFTGTWQSVPGSARTITSLSIEPAPEGGSAYDLSITVVDVPECGGSNASGTAKGSRSDDELASSWTVTCDGSGDTTNFDERFTYDAGSDRLTDSQGIVYTRN